MTLLDGYDGVLLDLDGTAYRGHTAVPGAVAAVERLRHDEVPVGFVTNNASRSPAEVAAHLDGLGFPTDREHVVTSAQAGAALLAERLTAGATVLVVGTDALADEVRSVGLDPVRTNDDGPVAVVQGHSPQTCWRHLAEACLTIRGGALWVACNVDPTLPTERGQLPGNGSMVAALRTATGAEPLVAGKPQRRLLDTAATRLGLRRPLVVGDRLDTDIAGARAAGMDSLLVLTGVSTPADLLVAPEPLRPTFVAADLAALRQPAERFAVTEQPEWAVELSAGTATLFHRGDDADDPLAALRALCASVWSTDVAVTEVRAGDEPSTKALAALALS